MSFLPLFLLIDSKMSSKNRGDVEREKNDLRKRLHELGLAHENITRQMKEILAEANTAGIYYSVPPPMIPVGTKLHVFGTDVESPSDFWVHCLRKKQDSMDSLINTYCRGRDAVEPGNDVMVGTHCYARACSYWFRSEVEHIRYKNWDNKQRIMNVQVRNLDVGTLHTVLPRELRVLGKECPEFPAVAMHCKLSGVVPYSGTEWSREANDEIHDIILDNNYLMTIIDFAPDGMAIVDLCDETIYPDGESVGKLLIMDKYAKKALSFTSKCNNAVGDGSQTKSADTFVNLLGASQSSSTESVGKSIINYSVPPPMIAVGTELDVSGRDAESPSDFWVQCLREQNDAMDSFINTYCKGPDAVEPGNNLKVGTHCCAWDEKQDSWFRSEVKFITYNCDNEQSIKNVRVCFLDVGTLNTVLPRDLRILSKECAEFPALAMHCKLSGVVPYSGTKWSHKANDRIHDLIRDNCFLMKIIDFAPDGMAIVELNFSLRNIQKCMIWKKLAKSESFASSNKVQK